MTAVGNYSLSGVARLGAALALSTVALGTAPAGPGRAGPALDPGRQGGGGKASLWVAMTPVWPPCVGETRTITALLLHRLPGLTPVGIPGAAVVVEGASRGTLEPIPSITDWDGWAQFTYTAESTGDESLIFSVAATGADGSPLHLITNLRFRVDTCDYTITIQGFASEAFGPFPHYQSVKGLGLASFQQGKVEGSGDWSFKEALLNPFCPFPQSIAEGYSTFSLSGTKSPGGMIEYELFLDELYLPPGPSDCTGSPVGNYTLFPQVIYFSLPARGGQAAEDGWAEYGIEGGRLRFILKPISR